MVNYMSNFSFFKVGKGDVKVQLSVIFKSEKLLNGNSKHKNAIRVIAKTSVEELKLSL